MMKENNKLMKKFLVLIVYLLLGTALQAQSVWYQSSKCYIGAKKHV